MVEEPPTLLEMRECMRRRYEKGMDWSRPYVRNQILY